MTNIKSNLKLGLGGLMLQFGICASSVHGVEIEGKLEKYHEILLKRPQSSNLFEKFQGQFLSEHSEKELEEFLKEKSEKGKLGDKQVYASYLIQRGKDNEAIEVLNGALKLEQSKQVYLDRGRVKARGLAFDAALEDLKEALKLNKEDARFELEVNKLIGRYLIRQGDADEAIAHWQKLADDNPRDQELIEDLIDILSGDGLYKPALAHAEKLRDNTRDPYKKALRTLRVGDLLQSMGERDKAITIYNDTLKLAGVGSWLEREILAQIETLFKREENLIGFKDKLLELTKEYPQRLQISQQLAEAYSDIGSHKEARELYLEIIKRSPNDQSLKNSLLQALDKAQDHKASKNLVESMIKLSPKDAELNVKLAEINHKLKDKEGAIKSLAEFKAKVDSNVANDLRHASLLRKFEFKEETLQAYEALTKKRPNSEDVFFVAAEYYAVSDKKDEAIKLWDSLADTDNVEVASRLLETLLFQNQKEKALEVVIAQKDTFKTKSSFVAVAMKVSVANKKPELSRELAHISLRLAKTPIEIDNAIKVLAKTLNQFDLWEGELTKLNEKGELTIKETFLKAQLLTTNGEQKLADELISSMSNSEDLATLLQVVRLHEQRYELDEAATVLEKIVSLPGGLKPSYLKQLSLLYKRAGVIEKALDASDRWKKLAPNDKQAWLTHVELIELEEGAEVALKELRRGLEKFEGETEIYSKLAALYDASNNNIQAGELYWRLYDEAKDISERTGWASRLAELAEKSNTIEELVDRFVERRRNSPQSIAPIMALSEIYRVVGREEERRNLMLEATRLRPDDATIFIEIANSDLKAGKRDEAIAALQKAQQVDKTDAASRKLAKLYIEDDDYEKGLRELEKTNKGKDQARSTETMVITLVKQDAYDEAHKFLQRKMSDFPEDGRLVFLSALINYELGYADESYNRLKSIFDESVSMDGVKDGWEVNSLSGLDIVSKKLESIYTAKSSIESIIRGNNSNRYGGLNYGNHGRQQVMPKDLEALKEMATLLFCRVLDDVDKDTQDKWSADVKVNGVKHLDLYRAVQSSQRYGNDSEVMELCLENLDDPFYLTLALNFNSGRGQYMIPEKLLKKAHELKEKLPEKLQKKVPLYVKEGTSAEDHSKHIISSFQENEHPSAEDVMLLLNVFSRNLYRSPDSKLPENAKKLFEAFLQRNPADLNFKFNYRNRNPSKKELAQRASYSIASMLEGLVMRSGDYKKIAELLNDDDSFVARSYRNYGSYNYGRGNNKPSLNQVDHFFTSLHGLQKQLFTNSRNFLGTGPIDYEKLVKELDTFDNPLLRYKLSTQVEPEKDHSKLLEGDFDDKYLADISLQKASDYFKKGEYLKAVTSLEQTRQMTKERGLRKQIDFMVLECSTALNDKAEFKKWDVELQKNIKSTARRLLLGRQITKAEEVNLILNKLDMQSESSRYLTKSNQSIRSQKKVGGVVGLNLQNTSRSSSSRNSNPWDKAEAQMKKGQKAEALRTVSNALKSYFRVEGQEYYVGYTVKFITKNKLEEQVLERLSPKDSVSPRKWLIYYKTAKALKNQEEVDRSIAFLKNLSVVPSSVKLPLALALLDEDPERALKMLKQSSDKSLIIQQLGSFLNGRNRQIYDWDNREEKDTSLIDEYLKVRGALNEFLESLEPEDFVDHSYGNFYGNTSNYQNRLKEYFKKIDGKVIEEYEEKIEKLNLPLHQYALRNPHRSELGFQNLHAYYSKTEQLDTLEKLLLNSLKETIGFKKTYQNRSYNYSTSRNSHTKPISRSSFLGSQMLKKKNTKIISNELIKSLEPFDQRLVKELRFYQKHLFLDNKKLTQELNKLADSKQIKDYLAWAEFFEVKSSESLEKKYGQILVGSLIKKKIVNTNPNNYNFNSELVKLIDNYIGKVIAEPSADTIEQLEKLMTALGNDVIGKATTDKAKLDAWAKQASARYSRGVESSSYTLFSTLTAKLARTPLGAKLVVKASKDSNYPHFFNNLSDKNSYSSGGQVFIKNEDDWIKALRKANFLSSPSDFKVTQFNSFDQINLSPYAAQYSNLSYEFNNYDTNDTASTDVELIGKTIRYYASERASANDTEKKVIEKLSKIRGKEELTAQLLVVILKNRYSSELARFCKDQKQRIIDSPDSFKQALVSIFKLNTNRKNLSYFKQHKLDQVLPLDEELLSKNSDVRLKRFLELKAPLNSNALYPLAENVVELIHNSIEKDSATATKVLHHFIDLVKGSPDASRVYYENTNYTNSLQSAWIRSVMTKLVERKIYPKQTLPLVYSLYQREDAHLLNFTKGIEACYNTRWVTDRSLGKNTKESVAKLFGDFASFYSTVKSEDERKFYRTAWFCHMNRHFGDGNLKYNPFHTRQHIRKLKKENKLENEFYDWMISISDFESAKVRNAMELKKEYNYFETTLFTRRMAIRKSYDKFFKSVKKFPLGLRVLMANASCVNGDYVRPARLSRELENFVVDTFIEAVNTEKLYRVSNDTRFMTTLHGGLDFEHPKKAVFAKAAVQCLKDATVFFKNGGRLHKNHLQNLAVAAGYDSESVKELSELINKNPDAFQGLIAFAHVMLKNGYVSQAYKILDPSIIMSISSSLTYRTPYSKGMEDSMEAFLDKYKDPDHKATAAAILLLEDDDVDLNDESTSFINRVSHVIDLARIAEPDFPLDSKLSFVANKVDRKFSAEQSLKSYKAFDKMVSASTAEEMKKLFAGSKSAYSTIYTLRPCYRYLMAKGDTQYIEDHIAYANELCKDFDKLSRSQVTYLGYVVSSFVSTAHEMWISEKRNAELTELLPLYRKILLLKSKCGWQHKKTKLFMAPKANFSAPYIHDDLGKGKDWDEFLSKNKLSVEFTDTAYLSPLGVISGAGLNNYLYFRPLASDGKKLILKMLNNKRFQKHVVGHQDRGALFDYLYDFGLIEISQARALLESGKIKIHEPSFKAIMEFDLFHFAGIEGRYEDMVKHANSMKEIFAEHPTPKKLTQLRLQLRVARYYIDSWKKEEAKAFIPTDLLPAINAETKKYYDSMRKALNLPEIKLKGEKKKQPEKDKAKEKKKQPKKK